ncbi:MAG: hypothetical protein WAV23_03440 [Minisyncoccia bacterium]
MEPNKIQHEERTSGALIGSVIIIIILIVGGIYFWQTSLKEKLDQAPANTNLENTTDTSGLPLNIQKDLNNINSNNPDEAI